MSRFARGGRVFFVEEPVFDAQQPWLSVDLCPRTRVNVVVPHLNPGSDRNRVMRELLADMIRSKNIVSPVVWFYTPMALQFFPMTITPKAVVYDCMDELSMFRDAPKELHQFEEELLKTADLVFTGGVSLFEAKRHTHPRVHAFPSGVDAAHFAQARSSNPDFAEQEALPHPRLGYAGVIDERIDLPLIDEVARLRPDWQWIMIGPTAKISPDNLPRRQNIHWLGMKNYSDLPQYFAGWDVGIMPFAINDATRFISPTKTPEYLSAGLPVVSTAIRDVVRPYGELGLARIAETPAQFVEACEQAMAVGMCLKWRQRADEFLRTQSWDSIWGAMHRLIEAVHPKFETKPALTKSVQEHVARV